MPPPPPTRHKPSLPVFFNVERRERLKGKVFLTFSASSPHTHTHTPAVLGSSAGCFVRGEKEGKGGRAHTDVGPAHVVQIRLSPSPCLFTFVPFFHCLLSSSTSLFPSCHKKQCCFFEILFLFYYVNNTDAGTTNNNADARGSWKKRRQRY